MILTQMGQQPLRRRRRIAPAYLRCCRSRVIQLAMMDCSKSQISGHCWAESQLSDTGQTREATPVGTSATVTYKVGACPKSVRL